MVAIKSGIFGSKWGWKMLEPGLLLRFTRDIYIFLLNGGEPETLLESQR